MQKKMYTEIMGRIIQAIESGIKPWKAPYHTDVARGRPINFLTRAKYRGANSLLLMMETYHQRFSSDSWLTFKQALALGGKVRKGERATRIIYFSPIAGKNDSDGKSDDERKVIPVIRFFNVFNVDQTEGLPKEPCVNLPVVSSPSDSSVLELVQASRAAITHSDQKKVYYSSEKDFIHLPHKIHFRTTDAYCSTLLHELVHWSGHGNRLNRLKQIKRFGDQAYAFEELVAELGATFLSADLGVQDDIENHASYLDYWAKLLNEKQTAFFKAATLAEEAVQYLQALTTCLPGEQFSFLQKAA